MGIFNWFSAQGEPLQLPAGAVVIDVRSPAEYRQGHVADALNWPLDQLQIILNEKKPDLAKPYVVYCARGPRAGVAKTVMTRAGFKNVINAGGISDLAHLGISNH